MSRTALVSGYHRCFRWHGDVRVRRETEKHEKKRRKLCTARGSSGFTLNPDSVAISCDHSKGINSRLRDEPVRNERHTRTQSNATFLNVSRLGFRKSYKWLLRLMLTTAVSSRKTKTDVSTSPKSARREHLSSHAGYAVAIILSRLSARRQRVHTRSSYLLLCTCCAGPLHGENCGSVTDSH